MPKRRQRVPLSAVKIEGFPTTLFPYHMQLPAMVLVSGTPRQALLKSVGDKLGVYTVGSSRIMRHTVVMSPKAMINLAIHILGSELVPEDERLSIRVPKGRAPLSGKISSIALDALTREERLAKHHGRHVHKDERRTASESLVCPLGMSRGIKIGEFMIGFDPTRELLWWNSTVVEPQDLIEACEWIVSDWLAQSAHPSLAFPWVPVSSRVELLKAITAPSEEELLNGPQSEDPLDELRKLHPDASGVRLQQIRDGLLALSFKEHELNLREAKVAERERQVADDRELTDASMHEFDIREALSKAAIAEENAQLAERKRALDAREDELNRQLLSVQKSKDRVERAAEALERRAISTLTEELQQLRAEGIRTRSAQKWVEKSTLALRWLSRNDSSERTF